jgi:hypothetical protein
MSTAAAIAAVTAVLKDLLSNGLIDRDIVGAVGDIAVTAQAPDQIDLATNASQLNLFLYLVSRNQGWANVGYPSRDANGDLISAPPLALDLHYLLTAYGAKDLHSEILLGYAMQLLHEMPVLTRPAIRNALSPTLLVDNGDIPAGLRDLFQSGLADQIEQIKICQTFLSTDEMFKLWMAFSAPYRPTAAYHVSVVLIESERQGKSTFPVQQFTVNAVTMQQPTIDEIRSRAAANEEFKANQPILSGHEVALVGSRLRSDNLQVFVGDLEIAAGLTIADRQISFPVPNTLRSGIHAVHISHLLNIGIPPDLHRGVDSNALPMVLRPTLSNISANITQNDGAADTVPREGEISVDVTPDVGRDQRVTMLLNEFNPPLPSVRPPRAYRIEAPSRNVPGAPEQSGTLVIPFEDVLPATYLMRLRIDGAESPLGVSATGEYNAPQVDIT